MNLRINPLVILYANLRGLRELSGDNELPTKSASLILMAEDDSDQRGMLEMLLLGEKYNVITAVDGAEAWELLQQHQPDLLITDIMMPNMDGIELVKLLKDTPKTKDIAVLVLTAIDDREKEFMLLSLGADDYCEKTVPRKILLKRIENMLKRRAT